nr:acyltransferase domain-containing protein [uncultured Roseateles sp.]
MSVAIVFSGQGHQHPAMLPWLRHDATIAAMAARLRVEDWRAALADEAWAHANRHAQVLITATAVSAWTQLRVALRVASIEVDALAGYSVGELAACAAAGVFSPERAVALATRRAALMDAAGSTERGGLCGVTGLGAAVVDELLHGSAVTVAIRNGEDSVVIGGPLSDSHAHGPEAVPPSDGSLDAVEAALAERGARCTRLAVTVASHTPLMRTAAEAFAVELAGAAMDAPALPVFDSDGNRSWTAEQARDGLSRQIATTVRWDVVMDQLAARAPSCVLEIGGGQALARLWQRRHPAIPARSADEFRTVDGVIAWIERCNT